MNKFKRFVPLVAVAYTAAIVILQAWGQNDLANSLKSIGGLVNLDSFSTVSGPELTAAGAMLAGVVLKVLSLVNDTKK